MTDLPPTADPTDLPNVAAERFGATVVACSDEFFGSAFRLLHADPPVARPQTYDEHGQWMDGWETRRHRAPAADWVIVRLGAPTVVRAVVIGTTHFSGNQPERAWVDAAHLPGNPSREEVQAASWVQIAEPTALSADSELVVPVSGSPLVTHVRLVIDPDGGISRLRVHGEVVLDPRRLDDGLGLDLAAAVSGGVVEECSDMHFGSRGHLVEPGEARTMGEGWETRRGRLSGRHDWARIRLAAEGRVHRVVVDTRRFRGNAPRTCHVEVSTDGISWSDVLGEVRLQPDQIHELCLPTPAVAAWLRLVVAPDGGVARLHAYGQTTPVGRAALALRWLNALPGADAEQVLLACCGSTIWAAAMAGSRPFDGSFRDVAQATWESLEEADWREALAAHPRIGDRPAPGTQESAEQAGAADADAAVAVALVEGNKRYEERFGFTYVVRAAGRTAAEMLALLQERLEHDPSEELAVAAEQQAEITALRLSLLVDGPR